MKPLHQLTLLFSFLFFAESSFASSVLRKLTYSAPEPLSILLFGTGLMTLGFRHRRLSMEEA